MNSERETSTRRSRLLGFFSNPWVGVVATVASIVGLPLAAYFYFQSVSYPDLVHLVNPIRTIVVKQGAASRLVVAFDGQPVTQDVTAAQVAIWNRGREPIRRAEILQAVTITTEPRVPILEATIRKTSRDVAGFDLDRARLAQGEVPVTWNILEQDDGAAVQLVYAGDPSTQIHCRGVIEGQRALRELKIPSDIIESPESQLRSLKWARYLFLGGALLMLTILVFALTSWKAEIAASHGWVRLVGVFMLVASPAAACLLVYLFLRLPPPGPPFGF